LKSPLETVGELFVVEAEFVALAVDVTLLEAGAGLVDVFADLFEVAVEGSRRGRRGCPSWCGEVARSGSRVR